MTVYDNWLLRPIMRRLALWIYRGSGWSIEGETPDLPKCVIIAAPHTSNWDFFYTLCLAFIFKLKPTIMMKRDWFFWPLGQVLKWLGAMPVDRTKSNNLVAQSIAAFDARDRLMLVVPPSGTRGKVVRWKTGFYHIACGARVPVLLGFLDYEKKAGGFGPAFHPTGNIDIDLPEIRFFYRGVMGKYPERMAVDPEEDVVGAPIPAVAPGQSFK
jgi:1-acyl-sn-glycerol-3-phosphate acyltransferase